MKITLRTIPHKKQRYPTVGDWQLMDKTIEPSLVVTVSKMSDHRYEFLVGLHEMVEALLCHQTGVSQEIVDLFDMRWEKSPGHEAADEPGDDLAAPYRRQHAIASVVERLAADLIGVDWNAYAKEVESL